MKEIGKAIKIGLVCSMLALITIASADDYNVTVQWTIPSDYTVTITYPTALAQIEFEPAGKTFVGRDAKSQVDGTSALNLTHAGNVNLDIDLNMTGTSPTGVTFLNVSKVFATENQYYWIPGNWTTQQTFLTGWTAGSFQNVYCWSSGTNVPSGSPTATLRVNSSAS